MVARSYEGQRGRRGSLCPRRGATYGGSVMRREGHIRQRGDTYELRFPLPSGPDGKRRIATATVRGTRREAERELRRRITEVEERRAGAAPAKFTVADWLRQWLDMAKGEVRPITHERYEAAVRLYLTPALGSTKLRDLSPKMIQTAFSTWAVGGRHRGEGGLAKSTLGLLRKTLHAALQRALELEMIGRHPMAPLRKRLPTGAAPEAKVIDPAQTTALLNTVRGSAYFPAILLAITCGLRRGEVCALRWRHVDLDAGTLTIAAARVPVGKIIAEGETKTGRSRTVAIPAFAIVELRRNRAAQAEALLSLGMRLD